MRRSFLVLALLWAFAAAPTRGAPATPRLPTSPPGEVLVLSINLKEAYEPEDVLDSTEARNLAARIRDLVSAQTIPFAPDVILAQEVVNASAARLAKFLRETTGHVYAILVGPDASPIVKDTADYQILRDTAVLINQSTMEAIGPKGYVTARYGRLASRDAAKPGWKQHAFAGVAEKAEGGMKLSVASVHFTPTQEMASESLAFDRKGRWAEAIARRLAERFPKQSSRVVGGDLNNRRCLARTVEPPERADCDPPGPGGEAPFWTTLTQPVAPFHYEDAVHTVHGATDASLKEQYRKGDGFVKARLEFLFARAKVVLASHDTGYAARRGGPGYISDDRLLWALLQRRGA